MNEEKLHEILICTDPNCGFRFPLSPTEKRPGRCPKCGAPVTSAEEPYHSFAVPAKNKRRKKLPFAAVLDNIRSTYNVGSIFRTSDGAGIDKLYLCGITPTPEHPKVGKTALDAERSVVWEHSWSVIDTVKSLRDQGYMILALEGGPSSVDIFDSLQEIQDADRPIALVVGNEISGVDPEVVANSSMCIYIPMEGVKESLNVASAFAIAAYLIRYRGMKNE